MFFSEDANSSRTSKGISISSILAFVSFFSSHFVLKVSLAVKNKFSLFSSWFSPLCETDFDSSDLQSLTANLLLASLILSRLLFSFSHDNLEFDVEKFMDKGAFVVELLVDIVRFMKSVYTAL